MARRPRRFFKASPWELEDAEEEQVEIVINHAPKRFVLGTGPEAGKLVGMEFEQLAWTEDAKGKATSTVTGTVVLPCDTVILAIGQENAFPFIERDGTVGIEFDKWDMPLVDKTTFQSSRAGVFFGGDAAFGPQNIIWAVAHGHEAAISIDKHCRGQALTERPKAGMNLVSQKMGLHEWSYHNDYSTAKRTPMKHVDLVERFKSLTKEVEMGFDAEQTAREVQRCLNCDVQTKFTDKQCIECDACIDVCPVLCLTIAPNAEEPELRKQLTVPALNKEQSLFASGPLPQTRRIMVKDEDLCVHCGLCAERCPTGAWDMQKLELVIPRADSLNRGTGSLPLAASRAPLIPRGEAALRSPNSGST
jgi:ferredoxin